ncbi:MAG: hypothetical protein HN353_12075 [Bdellovibrionales bacterium]|jgi:hypothetical protein|nr:hypothetical protein [Bdellovibrionales bacterium]MBT3526167.1 hypothetical protein [Bdellovibrionales bacterium]MBT7668422.1 hypothetical protein [Bdellovibrionales bacterium]MBT7766421.1 hypothetical protein [Bdellovibrionales bacterium]
MRTVSGTHSLQTLDGSSLSLFNPDLSAHYAWDRYSSIGFGADLHFNLQNKNVALFGIRAIYRLYVLGRGYPLHYASQALWGSSLSNYALYVGTELKRYNYFLGENPSITTDYEQNGIFYNINLLMGFDYRLSHTYEINTEFNFTVASLASTDNRITMSGTLFFIGLTRFY